MRRLLVPALTSAGLIGGYGVARGTGVRWSGGVVLAAGAAGAGALVAERRGGPAAALVVAGAILAFAASHPLAKRLGAWPSVLTAAAVAALPATLLAER